MTLPRSTGIVPMPGTTLQSGRLARMLGIFRACGRVDGGLPTH